MNDKHIQLLYLARNTQSDANPSCLLSHGANPNFKDRERNNWTALFYAVFYNKENFALELLKYPQVNVKLLDSDGFSPLYWAAKKSTPRVVKALLNAGCDPNSRNMHGMTPMFAAVAANKTENVCVLATHPSFEINHINQYGGSVLHHTACTTDNVEIANILVQNGANVFLMDYVKQYPLHVAKKQGRKQLFKYLKNKMKEKDPNWKCDMLFDEQNEYVEEKQIKVENRDKPQEINIANKQRCKSVENIFKQFGANIKCDKELIFALQQENHRLRNLNDILIKRNQELEYLVKSNNINNKYDQNDNEMSFGSEGVEGYFNMTK